MGRRCNLRGASASQRRGSPEVPHYKPMRYVLFFLCCCWACPSALAQAPVLRGRVLDADTRQPVPFAQVGVGGGQLGTSTNAEGRFALAVPVRYAAGALEVAVLGYEKYRRNLPPLPGPELLIELRPQPAVLGEVAVRGSVLGLIREAVARIPLNYPTRPTQLEGFFRESDNEVAGGAYRYLGEAALAVGKAPYTAPHDDGTVVIEQARKVDLQAGASRLSRPHWYAGPFIAHRFDFVHNRLDFINEADFRDYDYRLLDLTTYQGRPVYVIGFGPKPGNRRADFAGQLYLDQESYAFLAAEWHRTPAGLRHELSRLDFVERAYRVDYQLYAGRLHLKSVWYHTHVRLADSTYLRHLSEFVTTAIDTAARPAPGYTARAQFRDVFLATTVRYDSAFWQARTTLLPPEMLRAALLDQERQERAEALFAPQKAAPRSLGQHLLAGLLDRLRFGTAAGVLAVAAPATDAALAFAPPGAAFRADATRRTPAARVAGWYSSQVQLDLTRRLGVFYCGRQVFGRLPGRGWEVGATYELNLRPRHRPLYLRLGGAYFNQRLRADFGTFANPDRALRLGGQRLDARSLAVAVQSRTTGWLPRAGLGLELSHRIQLVAEYGYLLPLRTRTEARLKEKSGFFLNRKEANVALSAEALRVGGQPAPPPWSPGRAVLTLGVWYRLR